MKSTAQRFMLTSAGWRMPDSRGNFSPPDAPGIENHWRLTTAL
jgi:hypothetical protein